MASASNAHSGLHSEACSPMTTRVQHQTISQSGNADSTTSKPKKRPYGDSSTDSRRTSDRLPTSADRAEPSSDGDTLTGQDEHDNKDDPEAILERGRAACKSAKKRFQLQTIRATGPSKIFNPTNVDMHIRFGDEDDQTSGGDARPGYSRRGTTRDVVVKWQSRDNRKGRNSIIVPVTPVSSAPDAPVDPVDDKAPVSTWKEVCRGLWVMIKTFPYWNMAFWSGWSYTWGSVLFVMDGVWAWGPVAFPHDVTWAGLNKYGTGLAFFFGALLYEVGAFLAYLEAVNDGSFQGSAMRRFLEGHEDEQKKMVDEKLHTFFGHFVPHFGKKKDEEKADEALNSVDPWAGWRTKENRSRSASTFSGVAARVPRRGGVDLGEVDQNENHEYLTWRWWPTWHALRTHHVYEVGFLACFIQLIGATLYLQCGIVALPGVLSSLKHPWQENFAYWVPQTVASCCFLSAGLLFTLETQAKIWKPEVTVLGWWIGLWATIGSCGFLLSAIFGFYANTKHWGEYQSDLSSMWGSFAYLCSGFLQWYEAVNHHPMQELFEPGEMKTWQIHPI